jgi:7,8-dihydropterin-6-yl-methyl-4-(beta-D-ribofuranosyl)aminobenzene 5'-phosphate synthase
MERNGEIIQDDFLHEQNLILTESGRHILLAGCAHCGIVNILQRARELSGKPMNAVIGGFHLHNRRRNRANRRSRFVRSAKR